MMSNLSLACIDGLGHEKKCELFGSPASIQEEKC